MFTFSRKTNQIYPLLSSVCNYYSSRTSLRPSIRLPYYSSGYRCTSVRYCLNVDTSPIIQPARRKRNRVAWIYDRTLAALLLYQKRHGNMLVPSSFRVPSKSPEWPEEMWEMKLGRTVSEIRAGKKAMNQREELKILGFDFRSQRQNNSYDRTREALLLYKEKYGDMLVPSSFLIPGQTDEWPAYLWGTKLGSIVIRTRLGSSCIGHKDDLTKIGFDFTSQLTSHEYPSIKAAMIKYKEIYGDLRIGGAFIVPVRETEWPKELRGIKLGAVVQRILGGLSFRDEREELENMGLIYAPSQSYLLLKETLILYQSKHGHMVVPYSFVIPCKTDEWPEHLWGIRLGIAVNQIRVGLHYKDEKEELIGIGFNYKPKYVAHRYESVRESLLLFKEKNGHMLVPDSFTIPFDSMDWPRSLWGMRLGHITARIRGNARYKNRRDELANIGFDFKPQILHYGYPLLKATLILYKERFGHMSVPYVFSVPSNDSWPREMWKFRLGATVAQVRIDACYHEYQDELRALGFDFTRGRGARTFNKLRSALLLYKKKYGTMYVPCNFCVPFLSDYWPRIMWGMALGKSLAAVRIGKRYKSRRAEFEEIGVQFNNKTVV